MSLTLDLPPSVEKRIRTEAAAVGKDADDFLCEFVSHEFAAAPAGNAGPKPDPADDPNVGPDELTPEQHLVRFERFLALAAENRKHLPPGHVTDDSYEAIYGEREDAELNPA